MLKSLRLKNLTVFPDAHFTFAGGLNVMIGENGSGKSHVLKAAYAAIAVSAQRAANAPSDSPTKSYLETAMADKLRNVFRPDDLGRIARRRPRGGRPCEITYGFQPRKFDLSLRFSKGSRSEVVVTKTPAAWVDTLPVFLPTRELLTIYPGFVSLYDTSHTEFEETWRDTCVLLGKPLARGSREEAIREMLGPLEDAMGGKVELDKSGRFYINIASGTMEIHLVAEGLRKLATIAQLIANGSLLSKGYLFWDEPESNLNPKLIKKVARTIMELGQSGIQIFVATHSLFLLRELYILQRWEFQHVDARYFGLHIGHEGGVGVEQGDTMDDVGSIAALNEDLQQSERYVDTEMGVPLSPTTRLGGG